MSDSKTLPQSVPQPAEKPAIRWATPTIVVVPMTDSEHNSSGVGADGGTGS